MPSVAFGVKSHIGLASCNCSQYRPRANSRATTVSRYRVLVYFFSRPPYVSWAFGYWSEKNSLSASMNSASSSNGVSGQRSAAVANLAAASLYFLSAYNALPSCMVVRAIFSLGP